MSARLRVLVSGPLPPPLGGMETWCQDFLRTGLVREFDVRFARSNPIVGLASRRGDVGPVPRSLNAAWINAAWMARLLLARPALAHVHTHSWRGFWVRAHLTRAARRLGVPTILHVHGAEFHRFYGEARPIDQRAILAELRANAAVVVLSERWRAWFADIGVEEERLVVLRNCVFLPEARGEVPVAERMRVLFLGRIERRKGVHELVAALERDPGLRTRIDVTLAGPRSHEFGEIAERVKRAGLASCVAMPGPLTGAAKTEAFRGADAFLLQSFDEGMPIGLLEAMGHGLPCVTTPVGGIPDVVRDGRNGLLIPPGDADALKAALHGLASDPDRRRALGEAARRTIEEEYSWSSREPELAALYRRVAGA